MEQEIWRPIPGYLNYEASSLGQIRNIVTGNIRKPVLKRNGYYYTNIPHDMPVPIHRLVCLAFHGESGLTVNHKDGNKPNNRADNLEWLSRVDNLNHAYLNGLINGTKSFRHIQKWKDGKLLHVYKSYREIEADGFRKTNVSDCVHKRKWAKTHYGFTWVGVDI